LLHVSIFWHGSELGWKIRPEKNDQKLSRKCHAESKHWEYPMAANAKRSRPAWLKQGGTRSNPISVLFSTALA
jgi:hypothetical protein